MDTNKLKRFAGEARNILIDGVKQRLSALGIREDGTITEKPELKDGGAVFMGDTQTVDFYDQFESLSNQLKNHSCRDVIEEVAYTWFNRLVAIRIMAKNGLIPPVLEYESEQDRIPVLVSDARQGRMPQMNEESRQKLEALLANDALTDEQFLVLIVAYCHGNPIINKCFGTISDYTELLLPGNILKKDGFIDRLNDDDYISDNDYKSPELIGWLYQFYISERKDEVFAKKGKFEADEIPAATQIFTPNWIVKYMVQNTVGRIYLDNNPYSDIKKGMQYLVEPAEPTPADAIYHFDDIHDLTCADLACGSGHILNECFDLLYQIYIEEGYNRKKAIEDIFRYNLTGIDIDTRAKQLATFALLLKACQKDNSFVDAHALPHVLTMPKPLDMTSDELNAACLDFVGGYEDNAAEWLEGHFELMKDADCLGSIMKFDMERGEYEFLKAKYEDWTTCGTDNVPEPVKMLLPGIELLLTLTQKYSALVMNPPYMGGGNMNTTLSKYVKENYEEGKADLFSVFMLLAIDRLQANGKYGMINMQSWMFLSSFEKLRKNLLDNSQIDNMLHLGPRTFDELSGEVVQNTVFVISKQKPNNGATYFRLVDGKNCTEKECLFIKSKGVEGNKIYYSNVPQKNFEKIPESPIGYWVSEKILTRFARNLALSEVVKPLTGLQTSDNARFVRYWSEVNLKKISFGVKSAEEAKEGGRKWFYYNKGGATRKWFGNHELVVNWENDGVEIKHTKASVVRNPTYYFKKSISWSLTSSVGNAFRYNPDAAIFDVNGMSMFIFDSNNVYFLLGCLNTKIYQLFANIINPTLALQCGDVAGFPSPMDVDNNTKLLVSIRAEENYQISLQDWDAHETSWDFQSNEIVALNNDEKYADTMNEIYEGTGMKVDLADSQLNSLEWRTRIIKQKWERKFMQLHANEEELNRQFIDIYGLQDELTPDVPLDEITILQQGEISIEDNQIVWHDDILMKQLISYAVGCMMGRYSIDKPGLILANQGNGLKEYEALVPNSRFKIDDDGIIPIMPANTEFTDNITLRFKTWLSITFGEDTLIENINFIEKSLGKRLDDYFVKDFWKYHKKMYQNRPIYWLFGSKKGAFQCIVYMHRMNAYTAEKIRTNYLLPHIEWLINKQSEMQANAADLSTRERKEMDNIDKQIEECREYHDRLHIVADKQIAFDLDDGVAVNYAKFGDVLMTLK
jgi:hypothetical protein